MQVIEHGKYYGIQKQCTHCDCIFIYNDSDVKYYHNYETLSSKFVQCPECGHKMGVK